MDNALDRILKNNGLTESGKSSQAYRAIQRAFQTEAIYDETLGYEESESKRVSRELAKQRREAEQTLESLKTAKAKAKDQIQAYGIHDANLVQAVNMYDEVLQRTRDAVQDDMTEAIWLKTIEAASYGMWRAIMGPKFEEKAPRRI